MLPVAPVSSEIGLYPSVSRCTKYNSVGLSARNRLNAFFFHKRFMHNSLSPPASRVPNLLTYGLYMLYDPPLPLPLHKKTGRFIRQESRNKL